MKTKLLACALLLASLPSALATWNGQGTTEPDTLFDQDPGVMWADPDTSTDGKRVYFNAFQTQYLAGTNPNVGATGTHQTAGVVHILAQIGLWKDCNDDGYIGMAEGALSEYRAELLTDDAICPAGTSVHNDGEWVFEFLHFGPIDPESSHEYNVIDVSGDDVRLWGDLGLPGALPGSSCPLSPPRGSLQSTGGMLRFADCSSGNTAMKTVNTVDSDGSLGLRVDDPKNPQESDSALNQPMPVNVFGNPYDDDEWGLLESGTGHPAFTTWDCSAEPTFVARDPTSPSEGEKGSLNGIGVQDPTGVPEVQDEDGYLLAHANVSDEEGVIRTVYSPAPALGETDGSYIDAANQTETGLQDDCDSEEDGTNAETIAVLANPEGDLQSEGQSAYGKDEVHTTFTFFDGSAMSEQSRQIGEGQSINYGENVTAVAGENTPFSLGIVPGASALITPGWSSSTIITSEEFYVSPEAGPIARRYFSFYASISPTVIGEMGWELPGGGVPRVYGAENCEGNIGPGAPTNKNGWACDPDVWYVDHISGEDRDPERQNIRVGDTYQLRDVDCFDGLRADPDAVSSADTENAIAPC